MSELGRVIFPSKYIVLPVGLPEWSAGDPTLSRADLSNHPALEQLPYSGQLACISWVTMPSLRGTAGFIHISQEGDTEAQSKWSDWATSSQDRVWFHHSSCFHGATLVEISTNVGVLPSPSLSSSFHKRESTFICAALCRDISAHPLDISVESHWYSHLISENSWGSSIIAFLAQSGTSKDSKTPEPSSLTLDHLSVYLTGVTTIRQH